MIVIGSRGSQLALWQANHIAGELHKLGVETRLEIIKTTGDKIQDVPLSKVGGKGLFTKEIEEALLRGDIDLAVHSMKDMPAAVPDGLTIAAIPEREEVRDAICGSTLAKLKRGARIGTSSLRRAAQLHAMQKGYVIEPLRGNVDTRLRKLEEGQYDAIILAAAGLRRLGWKDRIRQLIPISVMCPAVGQGALSIETRVDGGLAHQMAGKLDHRETRLAVTAERALLARLEGGCQVPIGAHATVSGNEIHLEAIVASPNGEQSIRAAHAGSDPHALGLQVADTLLRGGAAEILKSVYGAA